MTALLALGASLLWGVSDFLGGTTSRRLPVYTVIAMSQAWSLLFLLPVAGFTGEFGADRSYLPWGVAGGLVGLVALGAFYSALASGTMGVVAPIAAMGVTVPVVVGVAGGDAPSVLQLLGLATAVTGVLLASGPELRASRGGTRSLLLAGTAALGFGTVIVLVSHGSRTSVVMTLLAMRLTTVTLVLLVISAGLLAGRRRRPPVLAREQPLLAVIGAGDVGANACYAVASQTGLLSIVAVLASLYPAVTVLLARQLLRERLRQVQAVGVLTALGGVVLIAAGGGTG